jgi:hypothetical protein
MAKEAMNADKNQYISNKTTDPVISSLEANDAPFNTPRHKAVFLLENLREHHQFDFVISMYDESSSGENKVNFTKNFEYFVNLLDAPIFIDALYDYVWTIIYSYAIITSNVNGFIEKLITTINSTFRPNYIISTCNTDVKMKKMKSYIDGHNVSETTYLCGRALGKILEPNKKTRLVVYNTLSSDNNYMNEQFFERIKNKIGGKSKKYKRMLRRKSRLRKKNV